MAMYFILHRQPLMIFKTLINRSRFNTRLDMAGNRKSTGSCGAYWEPTWHLGMRRELVQKGLPVVSHCSITGKNLSASYFLLYKRGQLHSKCKIPTSVLIFRQHSIYTNTVNTVFCTSDYSAECFCP